MSTSDLGPEIPIEVGLDPALLAVIGEDGAREAVDVEARAILAALGIPGRPVITLGERGSRSDRALSLTVHGRALGFPIGLLGRAESVAAGEPVAALGEPRDALARLLAAPERVPAFLRAAARGALARRPDALLDEAGAAAWASSLAAAAPVSDPSHLKQILGALLRARISLAERDVIAARLSAPPAEPGAVAEDLAAALRPRRAEVRLSEGHLRRLTLAPGAAAGALAPHWIHARAAGLDPAPVSFVRDEAMAPRTFELRVGALATLPWVGLDPARGDALAHLVDCLVHDFAEQRGLLVDRAHVDRAFLAVRGALPALIAAVDRRAPRWAVTRALRLLALEGVSLRDLRGLLSGMVEGETLVADEAAHVVIDGRLVIPRALSPAEESSPTVLAAHARLANRRGLVTRFGHRFPVRLLSPELEAELAAAWPDGELAEPRREAIARLLRGELESAGDAPVILTTSAVRPVLARLLADDLPGVVVFAYRELTPDLALDVVGRVAFR